MTVTRDAIWVIAAHVEVVLVKWKHHVIVRTHVNVSNAEKTEKITKNTLFRWNLLSPNMNRMKVAFFPLVICVMALRKNARK